MNLAELRELKRLFRSFIDSGDVAVYTERFAFYSQSHNSPFLSHQSADFAIGHGVKDLILFYKGDRFLFALTGSIHDTKIIDGRYYTVAGIPRTYIKEVSESFGKRFFLKLGEFLSNYDFIDIIFPNRLTGFTDGDGFKPILDGVCRIEFKDENGNIFKYSDVEQYEDDKEEEKEENDNENDEEDVSI